MKEYRCTRNSPYGDRTPGYSDVRARQGHYIQAHTMAEAIHEMERRFPHDRLGFTVHLWRDEARQLVS